MADKKKSVSGGKKAKAKKPAYMYAKTFEVSGDSLKRKNRSCPKCGPGVWLASHKDRGSCGKCGYMEKKAKQQE